MNKTLSSKSRVTVRACKWFDRVNGNTYHTVKIIIENGGETETLKTSGVVYGYDDHWMQTACEMLEKAGYKLNAATVKAMNARAGYEIQRGTTIKYGDFYGLRKFARILDYHVNDDCKKRDALDLVR